MAAFPTLTSTFGWKPDSKDFTETVDNPAMSAEMEGGYEITRPRFTRQPRRTFKCVYRQLTDADKALIDAHWDTQKGGSLIFAWVHPKTGVTYDVRYKSEKLEWKYVGINGYSRWDCSFDVKQA